MSKIFGKNVLRTSAFALACLALVGADVKANGMSSSSSTGYESYYTLGSVGTTGVTGAPAIGFSAVGNNTSAPKTYGTFSLNSQVSLGGFTVAAPTTPGGTTSYKDTPFTIAYTPVSITGASASQFPNTTILITGLLSNRSIAFGYQQPELPRNYIGHIPRPTRRPYSYLQGRSGFKRCIC